MMIRYSLIFILAIAASAAEPTACTAIDGDQILGSDLARANAAFRLVPPTTRIAPAPLTGGTRIFSEPELETLAARYGLRIPGLTSPICFRVTVAPLNREAVIAAMQHSLNIPGAQIDLTELSTEPAPGGTIVFPIASLTRPAAPDLPAFWRGDVVSGNRHFNIWARARVLAPGVRIVALEELRQGVPVQARQIREEAVEGFPSAAGPASSADMIGLLPTRNIAAGGEIRSEYLTHPLDVARGDLVRVEVRLGRAHLMMNARAEAPGRTGDMIAIRNPESSRVFQARVEGKGRVLVDNQGVGEY